MAETEKPILWIVPETRGGIRSYTETLLPFIGPQVRAVYQLPAPESLATSSEEMIHVQHEYGMYGSKIPGRYHFPSWFKKARRAAPGKKWVATAHSVLNPDYRLPVLGRGWQSIPRAVLNLILSVPGNPVAKLWGEKTWGAFDGVSVLHRQQVDAVRQAGCKHVVVIPLPVLRIPNLAPVEKERRKNVTLFGYFSPEKGQDVAIRAWKLLGADAPKLILAGGVRRKEDEHYLKSCTQLIRDLGLSEKIEITGYVPTERLETIYAESKLILAPFRESTGSASIATGFAYGASVLASDLPLNLELDVRVPGCLAFFRSESTEDLARSVRELSSDESRLTALREAGRAYAEKFSSEKIGQMHRDFYRDVMLGRVDERSS